ncbi:EAL domain-containing protein [Brucella thiophenivorans]|uniref:cyclic-guanylate-specific phosphodiesterase n=1 Tax=Brucella thiophenivorans TaxID=571255 RepID=A0A256FM35_9HYPH|nr:EAL domain-containing protein [Brucella thiophenivorans]OYR15914.1 CSS motif domain associated with EAL family protein [Brucella thiophenivorans]
MLGIRNGNDRIFIALASIIGIIITLTLGQLELVRLSYVRLNDYRDNLLSHAVDVANDSKNTLAVVNGSDRQPCSDEDLTEVRRLAFKSAFLGDVGRVENDRIICTALWGRLSPSQILPQSNRVVDGGHRLWANASNVGKLSDNVDMVGKGRAIVFTSPVAFTLQERTEENLSAYIISHDSRYIYRSFGDVRNLETTKPHKLAWYDLRSRRLVSKCADDVDICVIASLTGVSMLQQSIGVLLAIGAFGAMAGGGVGLAAVRWRRGHSSLPQQIRRSIALERFNVVYQPLVRLHDEEVIGVEVLARLYDDLDNPIAADVFIPIAEKLGIIGNVTRLVIRNALDEMQPFLKKNSNFYLSINVSAEDVLDTKLRAFLENEVMRHGLSASQVILEVTERSTAHHGDLIEGMKSFRKSGYEFFIDDFGTGYSNLSYLAKLPINGIKIDRMFTQAIGTEAVSAEIVENICSIARRLDLKLVVEGIEKPDQAAYVMKLHPDAVGQGWLFGRPVPIADLDLETNKTT